ncbi:MAG TPA: hypothetical protein VK459_10795 [Polyangiaceae bacterium]|nr:hypothetical protein [Polyangiaceae bacterium]
MHQDEPKSFAAGPRSQAPSSRNMNTTTISTRPPPDDEAPSQKSAISDRGLKQLNDNIAILVRFLHKNVGRPWAKVHGEISSLMSAESAVQKVVLDRLKDLVATTIVMIDGKPHRPSVGASGGSGASQFLPLRGTKWDSLYVCPHTGLLRSVEREPQREPQRRQNPDVRPAGPLSQFRRINGVWYLVELSFIPSLVGAQAGHYDVLLHTPVMDISSEALRKMYGCYDKYAVAKRPVTKRELAKLTEEGGDF